MTLVIAPKTGGGGGKEENRKILAGGLGECVIFMGSSFPASSWIFIEIKGRKGKTKPHREKKKKGNRNESILMTR